MSITSVLQSQMIATLIEAMAASSAPAREPGAGDRTRALVLGTSDNGTVSVNIGGVRTELLLAGPIARSALLQPGTVLNLRVDTPATPTTPARATLLGLAPPPASGDSTVFGRLVQAAERGTSAYAAHQPEPVPAASARTVAGPLVAPLVVRQNGLAPLYANLEAVLADAAETLPEPVRAAAGRLLDLRLPAAFDAPAASALRAAVSLSGLTHEARLAAGDGDLARQDVKSALLNLKGALTALLPATVDTDALLLTAPRDEPSQPAQARPGAPDQAVATRPPAPRRDATPAAQGIAEPTLAGRTHDTPLVLRTLLSETEAALDRLTLSQYASLPAGAELRPGEQAPAQRWFAEIPMALAQGTAVLPLEIEREAARRDVAGADATIWRVRFALDGEPVGPLHALVTMQGRQVGVTVWAERETTSRMLHEAVPDLRNALTGDRFERAEIEVFTGMPPQPRLAAGQFLDRRS